MEAIQRAKEVAATDLGWLLDAGDDAMVTLTAGDTRLVAHKQVLVDRSPVFDVMFQHDMLESRGGSVVIPDVEGPVLRQLLEYLYTLQVPQLPDIAPQLLAAADKYGVSELKDVCEQQLKAQLSVETAAATAVLAIRHSCYSLREAAAIFIKSHLVEVMATQGWVDAVNTRPADVAELSLLLSQTSIVPTEAIQQAKEVTATDLGWLLDAGDDAMVTLIAGDTRLVAHTQVLVARSPVFDVMFQHGMLTTGLVVIPDVEGPVLRQLLEYLYTLQVPQLPDIAPELLAAADKYGVSALKDACEQQLKAQLSVETAAAAAILAIRHSCDSLREAAVNFIKSHLVEVMATQGWVDALNTWPADVTELCLLLSQTSSTSPSVCSPAAPVDGGTSPAAAPQPHRNHSTCSRTPASAAPRTEATGHGSPHDDAVSRMCTPATVDRGTSPAPTTHAHSDHSGCSLMPTSAATGMSANHQSTPHDEATVYRMSTPAAVDRGTSPAPATQPHSDHSACSQAPASVATLMASTNHGSPHEESTVSGVSTPAAVDRAASQPGSDHSGCSQSPASAAPPTAATHHGNRHDDVAVSRVSGAAAPVTRTCTSPATQAHSGHGDCRQILASAAPTSAAASVSSSPDKDAVSRPRSPAGAAVGTSSSPATQPHSDHTECSQAGASAVSPSASAPLDPPLGDDTVAKLRGLSPEEKLIQLNTAARVGALRDIEMLLAAGVKVDGKIGGYGTALHYAAAHGHVDAVKLLIAAGAPLEAKAAYEQTPLYYAVSRCEAAVVRLLLAANADPSARMSGGWTPLHYAAFYGLADMAAILLEAGADMAARSNAGNTPLQLARMHGNQQVVDLLQGRRGPAATMR